MEPRARGEPRIEISDEPVKAAPKPAASGGLKSWAPLLLAIALMPLLAYGMTSFILLPKLQQAAALSMGAAAESRGESVVPLGPGGKPLPVKKKFVTFNKMTVNVAGTMGTRYLMASITIMGTASDFKSRVEDNTAQLLDLATSTLSSKTLADLEKPGARNLIRTELIAAFNNALGANLVQELYITEFAVQ
jgi:flagellar protein FliL